MVEWLGSRHTPIVDLVRDLKQERPRQFPTSALQSNGKTKIT